MPDSIRGCNCNDSKFTNSPFTDASEMSFKSLPPGKAVDGSAHLGTLDFWMDTDELKLL